MTLLTEDPLLPGGSFASLSGLLAELETIWDFILTYLVEKFI